MTALSVVVPTRDRPTMLAACLASLVAVLRSEDELVVADSASADPRVGAVAARAQARLVRCDVPGASLARNRGWQSARHPLVAFVDDDCRVCPGWRDALVTRLAEPRVAFVTGRVDVPAAQAGVSRPVAVKTDDTAHCIDATTRGTLGASCNLAVRRDALEDIGGFDERLGPGTWFASAEDVDLFDRLIAAGYVGRYEPSARVEHEQWRTRRQLMALDWGYGKGMGARLAKLSVTDRSRARDLAKETVWRGGVLTVARSLRQRYEFGAATMSVRTVGTAVGYVVGRRTLAARGSSTAIVPGRPSRN